MPDINANANVILRCNEGTESTLRHVCLIDSFAKFRGHSISWLVGIRPQSCRRLAVSILGKVCRIVRACIMHKVKSMQLTEAILLQVEFMPSRAFPGRTSNKYLHTLRPMHMLTGSGEKGKSEAR